MSKIESDNSQHPPLIDGQRGYGMTEARNPPANTQINYESIPPQHTPTQQLMLMIQGSMENPNIDRDMVKDLWAMQKEARILDAEQAFKEGLSIFAGLKKTINKQTKGHVNDYADYPTLVSTITPWLEASGLSFEHQQDAPVQDENGRIVFVMVHCIASHKGGHTGAKHSMPALPDYENSNSRTLSPSQQLQAAITYAQRQTLKQTFGLAEGADSLLDLDSVRGPSKRPDDVDTDTESLVSKSTSPPKGNKQATATLSQVKMMKMKLNNLGVDPSTLLAEFGLKGIEEVARPNVNKVLKWIEGQAN